MFQPRSARNRGNTVAFEDAKHFVWKITAPTLTANGQEIANDHLPGRVYNPLATQVGGFVVVMGRRHGDWPKTRVLYYNIKEHSWSVVHHEGPQRAGDEETAHVVGLANERVFVLDADVLAVHCFDLILRAWIPLNVKGFTYNGRDTCTRCFMENINSFICWTEAQGPVLSVLDLVELKWRKYPTKGELPKASYVDTNPSTCCHGSTVYIAWGDVNRETILYLLGYRCGNFNWSKPVIKGTRPRFGDEAQLVYSSGRLLKFGGYGFNESSGLFVYSIENAQWHEMKQTLSEYTVQGEYIQAASHATVALKDKLIVFGGVSVQFKKCRILEVSSL